MQIHTKLKVGVIGLGHQSIEDHIPAIKVSSDVEFIAVSEINNEKLTLFLESNKDIKGYSSAEEMFKKEKLDLVIIAVPHCKHYETTILAIKNKVHVLKEKPLSISLKQAKEINKISKENNIKIFVTLQRRFNPIYSTFLQLLDKIGDPFYIESKYTIFTDSPNEGWRGDKKLAGGGCIIDMGYHMVDLLIWYFGLPDQIFTELSCKAKENIIYDAEDTAQINFKYNEKDIWGSLLISRVIPPKQEYFNVYGTRGSIHLERGKIERFSTDGILQESLSRENSWPSAFQDQLEYFIKVIKGQKENISSPEFHFQHLALIESAYKSFKDKKIINPKKLL